MFEINTFDTFIARNDFKTHIDIVCFQYVLLKTDNNAHVIEWIIPKLCPPVPFASKSGGRAPQLLWERRPWEPGRADGVCRYDTAAADKGSVARVRSSYHPGQERISFSA